MSDWSPAQPLPSHWLLPSAGFDGSGRVRVAYLQLLSASPVSTRVAIAERKNGAWVDVFEKKSAAGDIPIEVTLAAGADGSAAACFTSITSTDPATYQWRHHVTYAPAATRKWETALEIVPPSAPSEYARQRRVKVADNGTAVVIPDRFDGPAASVAARSSSRFIRPTRRGPHPRSSHRPAASMAAPPSVSTGSATRP